MLCGQLSGTRKLSLHFCNSQSHFGKTGIRPIYFSPLKFTWTCHLVQTSMFIKIMKPSNNTITKKKLCVMYLMSKINKGSNCISLQRGHSLSHLAAFLPSFEEVLHSHGVFQQVFIQSVHKKQRNEIQLILDFLTSKLMRL